MREFDCVIAELEATSDEFGLNRVMKCHPNIMLVGTSSDSLLWCTIAANWNDHKGSSIGSFICDSSFPMVMSHLRAVMRCQT